jgi:hypothetical protein
MAPSGKSSGQRHTVFFRMLFIVGPQSASKHSTRRPLIMAENRERVTRFNEVSVLKAPQGEVRATKRNEHEKQSATENYASSQLGKARVYHGRCKAYSKDQKSKIAIKTRLQL